MTHRTVRKDLYDYLTDGLSQLDHQRIGLHLARCKRCTEELQKLRGALKAIPPHSFDPSSVRPGLYWQTFASKVESRIAEGREDAVSRGWRLLELFMEHRKPFGIGFASALAVMLLALGVWGILRNGGSVPSGDVTSPELQIQKAALESRAYDYFDQSKVLILGIVHSDAGASGSPVFALDRKRQISKNLLRESKELTSAMTDPSYRRLKDLIGDLEVILLQISNLDQQYDSPAIEIVRSGVDRKGILLKLNLEEIQRSEKDRKSEPTKGNSVKPTT
ncbi:MAG: zf-HC2 domain-containing protein [Bacteroidota bacterium]